MSTQRFPNRAIQRKLTQLEDEVVAWAELYNAQAYESATEREEAFASERAGVLDEVAYRLHAAADLLTGLPARSSYVWRTSRRVIG